MVSFQCDNCADTVKKPALDKHRNRCWGTFTCLDCSTTFQGTDYKTHTSCISEAEKYEKTLYKGGKGAKNGQAGHTGARSDRFQPYPKGRPIPTPAAVPSNPESPAQLATQANPPAVHPSRLNMVNVETSSGSKPSFPSLHPASKYPPPRESASRWAGGRRTKAISTGMNNVQGEVPMRSWGTSPAVTDTEEAGNGFAGAGTTEHATKKKNKKKGDKGGTGSRANSKAKALALENGAAEGTSSVAPTVPTPAPAPIPVTSAPVPTPTPAPVPAPNTTSAAVLTPAETSISKKDKKDKKEKKSRKHSELALSTPTPAAVEVTEEKKSKKSKTVPVEAEVKDAKEKKEKKEKKERDETPEERAARKAAKKAKKSA